MFRILILFSISFPNLVFGAEGAFTWLGVISNKIHIPEHVITFLFIGLLLVLSGIIYLKKLSLVDDKIIPDKGITFRNVVEIYGNFIYEQCKAIIGVKEVHKYFGFIAVLFIFILLSNLIGLVPGFLPPTEHLSTTLALGVCSFIYYNIKGCKEQGIWNYIKHFSGPLWYLAFLFFPIELISHSIRPISLALRLRSNMMGDHLVLSIFSDLAPFVVPIIFMVLGLLVSFVQAYVFTVLSMVYISLAVSHHEGEH